MRPAIQLGWQLLAGSCVVAQLLGVHRGVATLAANDLNAIELS
jgi:hypothetical protein